MFQKRRQQMGCGRLTTAGQKWLESRMEQWFYNWGVLVARNPWTMILVPTLATAILAPFHVMYMLQSTDFDTMSEQVISGSRAWEERQALNDLNARGDGKAVRVWEQLMFKTADESSLMGRAELRELLELNRLIIEDMNVSHAGRSWAYGDFCASACLDHQPPLIFLNLFLANSTALEYTYPTYSYKLGSFRDSSFLGYNIQGAETDEDGQLSSFTFFQTSLHFILSNDTYHSASPDDERVRWQRAGIGRQREAADLWRTQLHTFAAKRLTEEHRVNLYAHDHARLAKAFHEAAMAGLKFFPVVLLCLCVFTVVNVVSRDRLASRPLEGVVAVVVPMAAIGTAFGFLVLVAMPPGTVAANSPFVVLAIGVDDAFLMLNALRMVGRSGSVEARLGEMLSRVGPSVTITSLTNAVSFGVGAIANSPIIQSYSIYTSVAVAVDWVFQLTMYAGFLALAARRERAGVNLLSCRKYSKVKPERGAVSEAPTTEKVEPRICSEGLLSGYVRLLVSRAGLVAASLGWLAYLGVAAWGLSRLDISLTDDRVFTPDSYYRHIVNAIEDYSMADGAPSFVLVEQPGDLRNESRLRLFEELLGELEASRGMLGPASTDLFLPEFLSYVERVSGLSGTFCPYSLPAFLGLGSQKRWAQFLHLDEAHCGSNHHYRQDPECRNASTQCLKKFYFYTGYTALGYDKAERVVEWRALTGRPEYADLQVTVFSETNIYGDQLLALPSIARTTILYATGFMILVCVVFIPSLPSVVSAVVAMVSINVGVLGGLALAGYTLNMITICCVLANIGFSVDYVAHMSYHYFRAASDREAKGPPAQPPAVPPDDSGPKTKAALSDKLHVAVLSDELWLREVKRGASPASSPQSSAGSQDAASSSAGSSERDSSGQSSEASDVQLGGPPHSGAQEEETERRRERIQEALEAIFTPTLQAAGSSALTLAVLPVIVGGYIYTAFFVTILLVVVFGVLHALFFLPAFLSTLPLRG